VIETLMRPRLVSAIHFERAQLDARLARRCRARQLRIGVWTVNDPDDARSVVALGARSIISDEPGVVRAVIGRT
jgi:glycerophosphoryl diester phosphodiesterase